MEIIIVDKFNLKKKKERKSLVPGIIKSREVVTLSPPEAPTIHCSGGQLSESASFQSPCLIASVMIEIVATARRTCHSCSRNSLKLFYSLSCLPRGWVPSFGALPTFFLGHQQAHTANRILGAAVGGPWTGGEVLHLWLELPFLYNIYRQVWYPCYILIDADLWHSIPKFKKQTHKDSSTTALPTIQYGKPDNAGWFKRKWQRSKHLIMFI